jgi:patatin-like phospholipase/acyl hydrolase
MGKPLRILAIDGGGIRGIIPAVVLAAIEKKAGKPICQLFDLIAGTSTGGILALGMVKPGAQPGKPAFAATDMLELYFKEGTTIFPQSVWREIKSAKYTLDEKYPSDGVESALRKYFGDSRLKEALTNTLITSYEIEMRLPWLFRSDRALKNPGFDFPMWQVARATSAAPTYFEPERIDKADKSGFFALIDGGMYANNPAMVAYAEALHLAPGSDVVVASLGTGTHTRPIPYADAKHWGLVGWAKSLLDVVFDGVSRTTDYQVHQLLSPDGARQRYYRFQLSLTVASDEMDNTDPENLNDLKEQAEQLVTAQQAEIDSLCAQLAV